MTNDAEIIEILRSVKTIAVVGASNKPFRASNGVSRYMQRQGYRMIGVNPKETEFLGEPCYPTLEAVPDQIDLVDVFRAPSAVPAIVDSVIALGIKALWLQEEVVHEQAAERARAAGVKVVMDRCIFREHSRLML